MKFGVRMMKIVLSTFLVVVSFFIYHKVAKARKAEASYLKYETHLSLIHDRIFKKKLNTPLPTWMKEQMDEDFKLYHSISKEQVDATYAAIREKLPEPYYIRYRIVSNTLYRYFPEGELIALDDNGLEKTFKTLLHYFNLPDADFIVGYIDGVPFPGKPIDFYHTKDPHMQAPLLVFARLAKTKHTILIPDWRSVADWWAKDVKSVQDHLQAKPWSTKKEKAFWRGGLTRGERLQAARQGLQHSQLLDIKLVGAELGDDLKREGVVGDFATLDQFMDYKYLPTFDGVICAYPAFQWRLLSNSVTLKQESDEVQWFYRAVKPYVHYIPLKQDLSDLYDQIVWAQNHDAECQKISSQAQAFAQNNLMMEDHYLYLYHVLRRYASLQTLKGLEAEMKGDKRWVNIQQRRAFKRKVKKEGRMGEYNPWLSPFATTTFSVGNREQPRRRA